MGGPVPVGGRLWANDRDINVANFASRRVQDAYVSSFLIGEQVLLLDAIAGAFGQRGECGLDPLVAVGTGAVAELHACEDVTWVKVEAEAAEARGIGRGGDSCRGLQIEHRAHGRVEDLAGDVVVRVSEVKLEETSGVGDAE